MPFALLHRELRSKLYLVITGRRHDGLCSSIPSHGILDLQFALPTNFGQYLRLEPCSQLYIAFYNGARHRHDGGHAADHDWPQ